MTNVARVGLFAVALGWVWMGFSGVAEAQAREGGRGGAARVIELDLITITGQVQRPNAFYILNRQSLGYEVLDLRTSFTREIIRSVGAEPF
jgi:hypothetical protein